MPGGHGSRRQAVRHSLSSTKAPRGTEWVPQAVESWRLNRCYKGHKSDRERHNGDTDANDTGEPPNPFFSSMDPRLQVVWIPGHHAFITGAPIFGDEDRFPSHLLLYTVTGKKSVDGPDPADFLDATFILEALMEHLTKLSETTTLFDAIGVFHQVLFDLLAFLTA